MVVTGISYSQTPSAADRVQWLEKNAAIIRSIDPNDTNYADLQPLQQAIGNARIVLLGGMMQAEVTRSKERLVRFLHEQMGFDVLVLDVPVFDAEILDRALDESPAPPKDLLEMSAIPYRAADGKIAKSDDLFTYARESRQTSKQLHISGYSSTVPRNKDYLKQLFQFIDRLDPRLAQSEDRKAVRAVLDPSVLRQDPDRAKHTVAAGLPALGRLQEGLSRVASKGALARELSFYQETLAGVDQWAQAFVAPESHRLSNSLAWVAKTWRPTSKIIVWGSNLLVGRKLAEVKTPLGAGNAATQSPGSILEKEFPGNAYAMGFMEVENPSPPAGAAGAPLAGNLESLLQAVGKPYLFVDLRTLAANHWLRGPLSSTLAPGVDTANWAEHFDGLFYIDRALAAGK